MSTEDFEMNTDANTRHEEERALKQLRGGPVGCEEDVSYATFLYM